MTTPAQADAAPTSWNLRGQVIVACNCDFGCPCNFNGLPTTGKCEGGWTWHVEEGHYGDVSLRGLTFSVAANWPGAIHKGDGEAVFVVDERADDRQRAAIGALIAGRVGGPWKIIATTLTRVHGPEYVPYDVSIAGLSTTVRAGNTVHLEMTPVRNAVTGADVHPRAILPEGFVFKEGDLGSSSMFRVNGAVSYDHSGRYAAIGPFEYKGP